MRGCHRQGDCCAWGWEILRKFEIDVRFQDNFVFTECRKRESETSVLFYFVFFGYLGLLWYFT